MCLYECTNSLHLVLLHVVFSISECEYEILAQLLPPLKHVLSYDLSLLLSFQSQYWSWSGYATCSSHHWGLSSTSEFLNEVLPSLKNRIKSLDEVIKRY